MKKQIAAGVLSLSMILTPTIPAWAEEALDAQNASAVYTTGEGTGSEVTTPSEGEGTTTTAVAKIGDTAYETLAQAVTAAAKDAVIDLKADAVLDATLDITKNITINGADQYKITAADSFSDTNLIKVSGNNVLKLNNVTVNANQKCRAILAKDTSRLELTEANITGGYLSGEGGVFAPGVFATNQATFSMNGGSITGNTLANNSEDYYKKYSTDLWIGANANGTVNTINGTVGNLFVNANSYSANNKGACQINGGKVTNVYVEYDQYGADFTYTDGEIENLYISTPTSGEAVKVTPVKGTVYNGGVAENQVYTVTFSGATVEPQSIIEGKLANKPANPKKSGYTFKGWYTTEEYTTEFDFTKPITANTTVYAKWSKNSTSAGSVSQTDFTITADKAEGGSVSVSQKEASAGTMITVSVTPAEGNKAGTVTVTDKSGNKVAVASVGTNKYTFTMPSSNVTVKAAFTKADGSSAVDNKDAIVMRIGSKTVNAYGKTITSDVAPLIVNDRTLVPIRIVTETLGGTANWNEAAQMVSLNINGKTVTMQIGVVLEKYGVAPIIIDSRTYVPIRFVAEELGATVDWNESTQEITITK